MLGANPQSCYSQLAIKIKFLRQKNNFSGISRLYIHESIYIWVIAWVTVLVGINSNKDWSSTRKSSVLLQLLYESHGLMVYMSDSLIGGDFLVTVHTHAHRYLEPHWRKRRLLVGTLSTQGPPTLPTVMLYAHGNSIKWKTKSGNLHAERTSDGCVCMAGFLT